MAEAIDEILEALPAYRQAACELREVMLANVVMIGEIPAPTFGEHERMAFLRQRFNEAALERISYDEVDNVVGVIEGANRERNILVAAHGDTMHGPGVNHSVSVSPERLRGRGLTENSLGVAALATLPVLIEHLDLQFDANIVLLGASRGLGRGNLAGVRFFLENTSLAIEAGICVESIQLGRLSKESMGMLRGEIHCRVPDTYDWSRFGAHGAVFTLNEVINRILEIPLPRRPRTSIVFGSVGGGSSYNVLTTHAWLRFEIRSESEQLVDAIATRVHEIATEVNSKTGSDVEVDLFAQRKPGGLSSAHPLVREACVIMRSLDLMPRILPSTSELSALIDAGIPALTLGVSQGEHVNSPEECVLIEPIHTGMAQLLGVLVAIDRGVCHAD